MAPQYLIEGLKGSVAFIADRSKIVTESLPSGGTRTRIPGRLSVCDCVNGNGRRYGKKVWERNFTPGSTLMQSFQENSAWGLLEHPKDGQITLQSPICIRTTGAQLQEGRDEKGGVIWEVVGEISILNPQLVPEAARLVAMIEEGYCPRVSSRGFGSLVRAADGVDDVQEDYVCEGWDVVMKPSFESAILKPATESTPAATTETKINPISETAPVVPVVPVVPVIPAAPAASAPTIPVPAPVEKNTLESVPTQTTPAAASAPVKSVTESSPNKNMTITEIKTQIASLRNLDTSKLNPTKFAEGMSQLSGLHQTVADFVAEDTKRSWQGQQLHEEIKTIETDWANHQMAPSRKASKLNEDNTKLMQVVKAVAKTALTFKNKLGEAGKLQNRQTALLSEVTERGQGWYQHAQTQAAETAKYKRRFMMASEALQQFATKYKTDITTMGKALLTMEFKDQATKPEFEALLKEAKKPAALIPIRAAMEGKITADAATSILAGKLSLDEALKGSKSAPARTQVTESKTGNPPVAGKKPASAGSPTAPVAEGVTVLSTTPGDPRGLNEAVNMVSRLSKAIVG